jgi:hypothetical protein
MEGKTINKSHISVHEIHALVQSEHTQGAIMLYFPNRLSTGIAGIVFPQRASLGTFAAQ